jgi:hypothetical protein
MGPAGPAGPAGESVIASSLPVGDPICAYGGAMFEVEGIFSYACNGANGVDGKDGAPGSPGTTGQDALTLFGSGTLLANQYPWQVVPGLTKSVFVPAGSKVVITADGGAASTSSSATGWAIAEVALFVDGNQVAIRRLSMLSTASYMPAIANWSLGLSAELPEGNHMIEVRARWLEGNCLANFSGPSGNAHQGRLTVSTLKL